MRIRFCLLALFLSVLMLFAGCDFLFDFGGGSSEPSVSGDDSNALFGYPSRAVSGTQLIERDAYTLLYSYDDLIPLWVSWHIDGSDMGTGREADFKGDPDVPDAYKLYKNDYTNSGFDRGHMCPNADRNNNDQEQQETFYMTNIVPQNQKNNRETWQNLEAFLGKDAEITVPKYVWKVALIMDDDNNDFERVGEIGGCDPLAVIMPNEDTTDHDWTYYIKTIDDVERLTGFDFFSALDDSIEADIESEKFDYKKF